MFNKDRMSKVYTILLVLFPFIKIYQGPISDFNFAELVMMFFLMFLIFRKMLTKSTIMVFNKSEKAWTLFLFLLFCMSLVSFLFIREFKLVLLFGRYFRWIFYTVILYLSREYLNKKLAIITLRRMAILACVLLWLQLIGYYTIGYELKFEIPGLKIINDQTKTIVVEAGLFNIFRPDSLFLEPSHFAYFGGAALAVIMFMDNYIKRSKKKIIVVFITISLLASTSAAGVAFVLICYVFYFTTGKLNRKRKIILVLTMPIVLLIMTILVYKIPYLNYAFERFSIGSGRIYSFTKYFYHLNGLFKLIGVGIGNNLYYFNEVLGVKMGFISGFTYIILQSGYIGVFIYMCIIIYIYLNSSKNTRVFVALFFASNLIELTMLDIYLPILLMWPLYFSRE